MLFPPIFIRPSFLRLRFFHAFMFTQVFFTLLSWVEDLVPGQESARGVGIGGDVPKAGERPFVAFLSA
jgi:hypothetical protein